MGEFEEYGDERETWDTVICAVFRVGASRQIFDDEVWKALMDSFGMEGGEIRSRFTHETITAYHHDEGYDESDSQHGSMAMTIMFNHEDDGQGDIQRHEVQRVLADFAVRQEYCSLESVDVMHQVAKGPISLESLELMSRIER